MLADSTFNTDTEAKSHADDDEMVTINMVGHCMDARGL